MKRVDGQSCTYNKGIVIREYLTGAEECGAISYVHECGGIYNRNYLDVLGNRDHDCFWNCQDCKYQKNSLKDVVRLTTSFYYLLKYYIYPPL